MEDKTLTSKDLKEIEMIYNTQIEHKMRTIQLNRSHFKLLLDFAKEKIDK